MLVKYSSKACSIDPSVTKNSSTGVASPSSLKRGRFRRLNELERSSLLTAFQAWTKSLANDTLAEGVRKSRMGVPMPWWTFQFVKRCISDKCAAITGKCFSLAWYAFNLSLSLGSSKARQRGMARRCSGESACHASSALTRTWTCWRSRGNCAKSLAAAAFPGRSSASGCSKSEPEAWTRRAASDANSLRPSSDSNLGQR
mmetsp:Transcript_134818/g.288454  ORF Transcript_134818/g.288454 Transcript_134818/m.288454 type:complete len:200 (-) Transcript_134818:2353-2952(-)